jgi:ABC-type transport system involved in multi-copper enzyme maturation permease subunit
MNITFVMMVLFIPFMMLGFSMSAFMKDENGKLEYLYLSLPLSRKNIVRGRYAFTLISVFASMIVTTGIAILCSNVLGLGAFVRMDIKPNVFIMLSCVGFAQSGFAIAVMYPLVFRVGMEKARRTGFYLTTALIILIILCAYFAVADSERMGAVIKFFKESGYTATTIVSLVSIVIGIPLYILSYFLSQKFYARRDF